MAWPARPVSDSFGLRRPLPRDRLAHDDRIQLKRPVIRAERRRGQSSTVVKIAHRVVLPCVTRGDGMRHFRAGDDDLFAFNLRLGVVPLFVFSGDGESEPVAARDHERPGRIVQGHRGHLPVARL